MGEKFVKSLGENVVKRMDEKKRGEKSMGENFVKSMGENVVNVWVKKDG